MIIKCLILKNIFKAVYEESMIDIEKTIDYVLNEACIRILQDFEIEEKNDKYRRQITYNPLSDLKQLIQNTVPSRIDKKTSIELLTDIHMLKWCEVNDSDWVIIS